jgi:hypothetical protein
VTWLTPTWPRGCVCRPVVGSPASLVWSSNEGRSEVPLVQPSPVTMADVEAMPVTPTQPKVDASIGLHNSLMQVTKTSRRAGRSDHIGWRSDLQPQFHGWTDRLGGLSDRQPLFPGLSDRLVPRSDDQPLFQA